MSRGAVENDEIVVGVKVLLEPDVVAVIAPERGRHAKRLARFPQKPPEELPHPGRVRGPQLIVGMAQLLGPHTVGAERAVVGVIQHPAQHNRSRSGQFRCGCCLLSSPRILLLRLLDGENVHRHAEARHAAEHAVHDARLLRADFLGRGVRVVQAEDA